MIDFRKDMRKMDLTNFFLHMLLLIFVIGLLILLGYVSDFTDERPKVTETFEQYIERSPTQMVMLYQHMHSIFADDLPPLHQKNIRQNYKQSAIMHFQILPDQLSVRRFEDEILARFIANQWQAKKQAIPQVRLHHALYGHCIISYPKENTSHWDISCKMPYQPSLNQKATKRE